MAVKHDFRVVQQCPVGKNLAPFIAVITQDAKATVDSIYRGTDAEAILNKYGKHSQSQLYWLSIHGTAAQRIAVGLSAGGGGANPPGYSTHEQRSDGVAYPHYGRGAYLQWWMCGFDVNDGDVRNCISVAAGHGWHIWQPYSSGIEWHHLNFASQPKAHNPLMETRIIKLRETLPRS